MGLRYFSWGTDHAANQFTSPGPGSPDRCAAPSHVTDTSTRRLTPMRFRFSLRSLLILPVLLALGFAWVTWPERTFQSFCSAIENGEYVRVNVMVQCVDCSFEFKPTPDYPTGGAFMSKSGHSKSSCVSWYFPRIGSIQRRGFADILLARVSFVLPHPDPRWPGNGQFECLIERGRISMYYRTPATRAAGSASRNAPLQPVRFRASGS